MPLSDAQRELVTANLDLPRRMVYARFGRFTRQHGDDLIGAGCLGLCESALHFATESGRPFEPWAVKWVFTAVTDEVRRIVRRERVPDVVPDPSAWEAERRRAEDVGHVRARLPGLVACLTPREWEVVSAVCGFAGEPVTQAEFAAASGVSRQAVSETALRAAVKVLAVL